MSKPQIKFTKYTANRTEARPYARLDPQPDPNAIQTLMFEDDNVENEKEDYINDTQHDNIADEPVPAPAPPPVQRVNIEDIKREMLQRAKAPVVRQKMPQNSQKIGARQAPQHVVQLPSSGVPSAVKWIAGVAVAGILYVALNGQAGGGKQAKNGEEEEYFY